MIQEDCLTVSWLLDHLEEHEGSEVTILDIMQMYEEVCATKGMTPMDKNTVGKILIIFFPTVKKNTKKDNRVYVGLGWKRKKDTLPASINIPEGVIFTENGPYMYKFWVETDLISNGSIIMFQVIISKDIVSIRLRGKSICLKNFGISNTFEGYQTFPVIIAICKKMRICRGIEFQTDVHVDGNIISNFYKDFISNKHDENDGSNYIRSKLCHQVLQWTATKGACRKCQRHVSTFVAQKVEAKCYEVEPETEQIHTDNEDLVILCDKDNADIKSVLEEIFPTAPENLKLFLKEQHKAASIKDIRGMRWDKRVIKLALNLWVRSPKNYQDIKDSGMVILPSGRHLRRYKNAVPQKTGINSELFEWMRCAADDCKVPKSGRTGMLIHDETKIQEGLIMNRRGKEFELTGFVETNMESFFITCLKDGKVNRNLATEALQVTFLGNNGFRFPVAHFGTNPVSASELYIIIWDVISNLQDWGFTVDCIMQDGGQQNRDFTHMLFSGPAHLSFYTTTNLADQNRKLVITQDVSHCVKKLRNSIYSSGNESKVHSRCMEWYGKPIVWQQWVDAISWDRQTNSRLIHQKISDEHLFPSGPQKMRNQLAEDMLNSEMLHLMQCYKASLKNGTILDGVIDLLKQSSVIITVFREPRPVMCLLDERLHKLSQACQWFQDWNDSVHVEDSDISKGKRQKKLPTTECMEDMLSMITGFIKVCELRLNEFPLFGIVPSRFNSDIIENQFCQQRGLYNGNNTNPTLSLYSNTVNSIIMGETSKSRGRKSNAGIPSINPFSFYNSQPLTKRPKKC